MLIRHIETLHAKGSFESSKEWKTIRNTLHEAIREVDWPPGSGKFTIYPESGKKSGPGNGVKPIKNGLIKRLAELGWIPERPLNLIATPNPGKLDIVLDTKSGPFAVEWETGNISSSHRALNKMALAVLGLGGNAKTSGEGRDVWIEPRPHPVDETSAETPSKNDGGEKLNGGEQPVLGGVRKACQSRKGRDRNSNSPTRRQRKGTSVGP